MKRFSGILALAVLMTACDDGDLTYENINFDTAPTETCGNKLYKLNDNEALIVNIGEGEDQFDAFFIENPTGLTPRLVDIISVNPEILVAYRSFDGEVGDASICSAIPPLNPSPTEDWTATSGFMKIVTTANKVENTAAAYEGGQKITGYRHNITFENIEFNRSNGTTLLYPQFNFGTFDKPISLSLPIVFDEELEKCPATNVVFNIAGAHAMVLEIDPALLDGSILDSPRTATVSATENAFAYEIYEQANLAGDSHFCTTTPEANPIQVWTGSGQIEVTTTAVGSSFQHTIVLKNIVLRRENADFILATAYNFGTLLTN